MRRRLALSFILLTPFLSAGCGGEAFDNRCQDACEIGASRCSGTLVERCSANVDGCFTWQLEAGTDGLRTVVIRFRDDCGNVTGAWEPRISSIGQVFEIVVMAMLGFSIRSFGFKWTMTVGTIAYLVRCLMFAGAISRYVLPLRRVDARIELVRQALTDPAARELAAGDPAWGDDPPRLVLRLPD